MNKKIVALVTLLTLAGFAAAAGALTVKQRQDTASLYAERYNVGGLFLIEETLVSPVVTGLPAAGVLGSPVELVSGALPLARTALVQDHWMYTVVVEEAQANGVGIGNFTIELQVNGDTIDALYVSQSVVESSAVEGVRASFDVGTSIESSSLYYVVVKPHIPVGDTIEYTIESFQDTDGATRWRGVGGPINGLVNTTLSVAVGDTLRLTANNPQGDTHNIGFRLVTSNAATAITPPGWSENIADDGSRTISWAPQNAGTYRYACQFHSSMVGDVVVAAA